MFQKLRSLDLLVHAGTVPVHYVPEAKERALRFQKSLERAIAWYEDKLHVKMPQTLAVLDRVTYAKLGNERVYPAGWARVDESGSEGLVVMSDLVSATGRADADADHGAGGVLQGEQQLFHEAGHNIAAILKIRSPNLSVNELVANLFSAAYVMSERPDFRWYFGPRPSAPGSKPVRYTSMSDLDYIYFDMGGPNYAWFQGKLERLAEFIVRDQDFGHLMEKVRAAFPSEAQKRLSLHERNARLEAIKAGFIKMAGDLAAPSTLPHITPVACDAPSSGNGTNKVVIQNDSSETLIATVHGGREYRIEPKGGWVVLSVGHGGSARLSDGTCLFAADEPQLAIIAERTP